MTERNHARDLERAIDELGRVFRRCLDRVRVLAPRHSRLMEVRGDLEELDRMVAPMLETLRSGAVSIYDTKSTSSTIVPPGYVAIGDRMFRGELLSNAWLLRLLEGLQAARKYADAAADLGHSPATREKALDLFLAAVKDLPREKPVEGFQPAGKGKRRMYYRGQNAGMGRN